jgi:hypothetical protein
MAMPDADMMSKKLLLPVTSFEPVCSNLNLMEFGINSHCPSFVMTRSLARLAMSRLEIFFEIVSANNVKTEASNSRERCRQNWPYNRGCLGVGISFFHLIIIFFGSIGGDCGSGLGLDVGEYKGNVFSSESSEGGTMVIAIVEESLRHFATGVVPPVAGVFIA